MPDSWDFPGEITGLGERFMATKLFGDPPDAMYDPFIHYVRTPLAASKLVRVDEAAFVEMEEGFFRGLSLNLDDDKYRRWA